MSGPTLVTPEPEVYNAWSGVLPLKELPASLSEEYGDFASKYPTLAKLINSLFPEWAKSEQHILVKNRAYRRRNDPDGQNGGISIQLSGSSYTVDTETEYALTITVNSALGEGDLINIQSQSVVSGRDGLGVGASAASGIISISDKRHLILSTADQVNELIQELERLGKLKEC